MQWLQYTTEGMWTAPKSVPPAIDLGEFEVREYQSGDGPKLFRAIEESRDAILPWMIWCLTDHLKVEDSIFYVQRFVRDQGREDVTDIPMGIFEKRSGELVGATGLHDIKARSQQAEIGYWLHPRVHGQGLMTRVATALLTQAFTSQDAGGYGLRRVVILPSTRNEPSVKVCERLGLHREGILRQERYLGLPKENPIGYLDMCIYAALRDEWLNR